MRTSFDLLENVFVTPRELVAQLKEAAPGALDFKVEKRKLGALTVDVAFATFPGASRYPGENLRVAASRPDGLIPSVLCNGEKSDREALWARCSRVFERFLRGLVLADKAPERIVDAFAWTRRRFADCRGDAAAGDCPGVALRWSTIEPFPLAKYLESGQSCTVAGWPARCLVGGPLGPLYGVIDPGVVNAPRVIQCDDLLQCTAIFAPLKPGGPRSFARERR